MANRFKLVLLLLIVLGLGILFVQNQQPLSLQILCPDANQFCLYQTRSLPLAAWMGLFILAGTITSFIWQLLNRLAAPVTRPKNYARADNIDVAQPQTKRRVSEIQDWDNQPDIAASDRDEFLETNPSMSSEYEVRREPESVTRSGSTYSYKFKDKNDEHQNPQDSEGSARRQLDENIDLTKDDEEWI